MTRAAVEPNHAIALGLLTRPFDEGVMTALAMVGKACDADRAWLYRYDAGVTRYWVTHEWCRAGVEAFLPDIQGVPVDLIAWVQVRFNRDEVVAIPDVEKIPANAQALKDELRREQVRACVGVPLWAGKKLTGVIGFDDVKGKRVWTAAEIAGLRRAGELIIAAEARPGKSASERTTPAFRAGSAQPGGVYLHSRNAHVKVAFRDIIAVDADGDYSRVHLNDGRTFHELRSLREWETVLPATQFLRVHRRHIANLGELDHLRRSGGGRWQMELRGLALPVPVGRQFQPELKRALALRGA